MTQPELFGTCILPGCRNPVVGEVPCGQCRDAWGEYLLPMGEQPSWMPTEEQARRFREAERAAIARTREYVRRMREGRG